MSMNIQYVVCYENKGNTEEIPFENRIRAEAFYDVMNGDKNTNYICLKEEKVVLENHKLVERNIHLNISYPKSPNAQEVIETITKKLKELGSKYN